MTEVAEVVAEAITEAETAIATLVIIITPTLIIITKNIMTRTRPRKTSLETMSTIVAHLDQEVAAKEALEGGKEVSQE